MRRSTLPAVALAALALLTAGCGDDGDAMDDPTPGAMSTATSDTVTDEPTGSATTETPSASGTTSGPAEAAGPSAKVEETAAKLDCTVGPPIDGFEGETEYECGTLLIVDWTTAGITEQEMFEAIDNWVDEKRPVWLYARDMVLVYGTQAELDAVSSEFE